MKTPVNRFKQAIRNKQVQYGLWVSMGSAYSTEICAGAGFDWLMLDCEHAPNDLQSIFIQFKSQLLTRTLTPWCACRLDTVMQA